jgi:hypothetical protein
MLTVNLDRSNINDLRIYFNDWHKEVNSEIPSRLSDLISRERSRGEVHCDAPRLMEEVTFQNFVHLLTGHDLYNLTVAELFHLLYLAELFECRMITTTIQEQINGRDILVQDFVRETWQRRELPSEPPLDGIPLLGLGTSFFEEKIAEKLEAAVFIVDSMAMLPIPVLVRIFSRRARKIAETGSGRDVFHIHDASSVILKLIKNVSEHSGDVSVLLEFLNFDDLEIPDLRAICADIPAFRKYKDIGKLMDKFDTELKRQDDVKKGKLSDDGRAKLAKEMEERWRTQHTGTPYAVVQMTNESMIITDDPTIRGVLFSFFDGVHGLLLNPERTLLYCAKVSEPQIPASVEQIAKCAFWKNKKLTRITFVPADASRLREIETQAFDESGLSDILLPDTVKRIDDRAFAECELPSIELPAAVEYLGLEAFQKCAQLQVVTFRGESILAVIGARAFQESAVKEITIPPSVRTIEQQAFAGCKSLAKLTLNEGLEVIGESAFEACIFEAVVIPASVSKIQSKAFSESGLKNLSFADPSNLKNNDRISIGSFAFANTAIKQVAVPVSTERIEEGAFMKCSQLENVVFLELTASCLVVIEGQVFKECAMISKIAIPNSVEYIGDSCFQSCLALKEVTFGTPDVETKLVKIGAAAFLRCAITEVHIPASVKYVEAKSFAECRSLKSATLLGHSNLLKMAPLVFSKTALQDFQMPAQVEQFGFGLFEGCLEFSTVDLTPVRSLVEITSKAFSYVHLKEISIPASVTRIGSNAFYWCTFLQAVRFQPDSHLALIGRECFAYTGITDFDIPGTVMEIKSKVFFGCKTLRRLTFAPGFCCKKIGEGIIAESGLQEVELPDGAGTIKADPAIKGSTP